MTWATRSGSQSASTGARGSRSSRCESCCCSAGSNSPATVAARARRVGGLGAQLERAGLQPGEVEQVGRELAEAGDLLADLVRKRSRVSSSRSSSCSSSRKPPSEKIGVRSSCEAVAMKRLRAESSSASWRRMSSSVRASWPSSSSRRAGSARRSRRRRRSWRPARAAHARSTAPARRAGRERARRPARQRRRRAAALRTTVTARSTSRSGAAVDDDVAHRAAPVGARKNSGSAASPTRPSAPASVPVAGRGRVRAASDGGREVEVADRGVSANES